VPALPRSLPAAFAAGAGVGVLGGLIGLGGAEFQLPLLIGVFGFLVLQAETMNKAMSLIVVLTALPARLVAVPIDTVTPYWFVVVNLLAGSLIGAWIGATWATRMRSATIYRVSRGAAGTDRRRDHPGGDALVFFMDWQLLAETATLLARLRGTCSPTAAARIPISRPISHHDARWRRKRVPGRRAPALDSLHGRSGHGQRGRRGPPRSSGPDG
jgi:hypothetical protein